MAYARRNTGRRGYARPARSTRSRAAPASRRRSTGRGIARSGGREVRIVIETHPSSPVSRTPLSVNRRLPGRAKL